MGETGNTVIQGQVSVPVLTQAVSAAYTKNPIVLFGTGAVVFSPAMPFGGSPNDVGGGDLGREVIVPYFNPIPPMKDLGADGDELVPQQITSDPETNTVKHSGTAVNLTDWTRRGQLPTYEEAGKQISVRTLERADLACLAAARSATNWGAYTLDVYSETTPRYFDRDLYIDGIALLGAHGQNSTPALIAAHSATKTRVYKTKNANGDPNLIQGGPGGLPLLTPYNVPMMSHDSLTIDVAAGKPPKYETLIIYPGAIAFWMNGVPYIGVQRNEAIPATGIYVHVWWVAHRYKRRDMSPIPGVIRLIHN